eukprot:1143348-Pelagomonas_calceolata.AAC.1
MRKCQIHTSKTEALAKLLLCTQRAKGRERRAHAKHAAHRCCIGPCIEGTVERVMPRCRAASGVVNVRLLSRWGKVRSKQWLRKDENECQYRQTQKNKTRFWHALPIHSEICPCLCSRHTSEAQLEGGLFDAERVRSKLKKGHKCLLTWSELACSANGHSQCQWPLSMPIATLDRLSMPMTTLYANGTSPCTLNANSHS